MCNLQRTLTAWKIFRLTLGQSSPLNTSAVTWRLQGSAQVSSTWCNAWHLYTLEYSFSFNTKRGLFIHVLNHSITTNTEGTSVMLVYTKVAKFWTYHIQDQVELRLHCYWWQPLVNYKPVLPTSLTLLVTDLWERFGPDKPKLPGPLG